MIESYSLAILTAMTGGLIVGFFWGGAVTFAKFMRGDYDEIRERLAEILPEDQDESNRLIGGQR